MKTVKYGAWSVYPGVVESISAIAPSAMPIWQKMETKHEGQILYFKLWNFWVRAGQDADLRSSLFFRDYERTDANIHDLLKDVGFPSAKAETEVEVWNRIGMVWNWLRSHVSNDGNEYAKISSLPGAWPSIADYAQYYATHGKLVWAACFSKAHLFATILGRMVYPRFRFAIAKAHHTEGVPPAPKTATHDYVATYVSERWFYLDPTAVELMAFPEFEQRRSIGVASFSSVDYQHPYSVIPVPLSGFAYVPHLPE